MPEHELANLRSKHAESDAQRSKEQMSNDTPLQKLLVIQVASLSERLSRVERAMAQSEQEKREREDTRHVTVSDFVTSGTEPIPEENEIEVTLTPEGMVIATCSTSEGHNDNHAPTPTEVQAKVEHSGVFCDCLRAAAVKPDE